MELLIKRPHHIHNKPPEWFVELGSGFLLPGICLSSNQQTNFVKKRKLTRALSHTFSLSLSVYLFYSH